MFELKRLSHKAVAEAMQKAERYRLLGQPALAESICRDVLLVEAENQAAVVWLLLSLTDQFGPGNSELVSEARNLLPRLRSEYERAYYAGIILERQGKARIQNGGPGSGFVAYELLQDAMECYEKAEKLRPEGNDDAILRWNTCARVINNNPEVCPQPKGTTEFLE